MNIRSYAVYATLGPATKSPSTWGAMLEAGATAFRLNTSHLTIAELAEWMGHLEPFFLEGNKSSSYSSAHQHRNQQQLRLALDLQGSKWRLGAFQPFALVPGASVTLTHTSQILSTDQNQNQNNLILPVPHADFFEAAASASDTLLLNDAKSELRITDKRRRRNSADDDGGTTFELHAKVTRGGLISPGKGITYSESAFRKERLSDKDCSIVETYQRLPFVQFAVSYVKDAEEMKRYCDSINAGDKNTNNVPLSLIAKLERPSAVAQADAISAMVDEMWLCRGDLGAEAGMTGMARLVHNFSKTAIVPRTLLAGQVLEHMTEHPAATRSEVCAMYDALQSGFGGFVLSDETAIGQYPLESCRTAAIFREDDT